MTNNNNDAFTDTVDPYQARNGRREALQFALSIIVHRDTPTAADLINAANQIDKYLEDGSVPAPE